MGDLSPMRKIFIERPGKVPKGDKEKIMWNFLTWVLEFPRGDKPKNSRHFFKKVCPQPPSVWIFSGIVHYLLLLLFHYYHYYYYITIYSTESFYISFYICFFFMKNNYTDIYSERFYATNVRDI